MNIKDGALSALIISAAAGLMGYQAITGQCLLCSVVNPGPGDQAIQATPYTVALTGASAPSPDAGLNAGSDADADDAPENAAETKPEPSAIFARVAAHDFHPLDDRAFTIDRALGKDGIADIGDDDWRVRLLAVRDLVRLDDASAVIEALGHEDFQVRYVAATALGATRATRAGDQLEHLLATDPSLIVRAQAAVALGQIGSTDALPTLREQATNDPEKDVRHQCALSIDQIEKGMHATDALRQAYENLDPSTFETARVGEPAPAFSLTDTEGNTHTLDDLAGKWTVLIWVFADWCPVCHGEFHELIHMREQYENAGVNVVTVETHDLYRARVMVGREVDPEYWFSKESFQDAYTQGIWWPHLMDRAGAVGATYGVDPMSFAVHGEYINRPSTFIIDPEGVLKMAYLGTYWGDRPTIEQTLEMINNEKFDYRNPRRLGTDQ